MCERRERVAYNWHRTMSGFFGVLKQRGSSEFAMDSRRQCCAVNTATLYFACTALKGRTVAQGERARLSRVRQLPRAAGVVALRSPPSQRKTRVV